jgi:hypothetical protein
MQPTAPNPDVNYFGVLRFQAIDAFLKTTSDNDDLLAELLGQAEIPRVTDWPKITQCIYRKSGFSLTAAHPTFISASLVFNPNKKDGSYLVRYRSHHQPDSGQVENVTAIGGAVEGPLLKPLRPFPHRFSVITTADDRAGSRMIWLVAFTHYTDASACTDFDLFS